MEFFDILGRRHSVRCYSSKAVEDNKLTRIFQAANMAPSAGNLQAYEVYVVGGQNKRDALARAALGQDFIREAPVCLVFCANPARSAFRYGSRGVQLYCIQDATIAATFAMLAAVDQGLATVWVGAFDEEMVRSVVGVKSVRPVALLPIGYAAERPEPMGRRAVEDVFHQVK